MLRTNFLNTLLITAAILCLHCAIDSSASRAGRCNSRVTPIDLNKMQGVWYAVAASTLEYEPECPIYNLTVSTDGSLLHLNRTYRFSEWINSTRSRSVPAEIVTESGIYVLGWYIEYHTIETDYDNYAVVCGYSYWLYENSPDDVFFKVLSRTRTANAKTIAAMEAFIEDFVIAKSSIYWLEQSPDECYRRNSASTQKGSQFGAILLVVLATGKYFIRNL